MAFRVNLLGDEGDGEKIGIDLTDEDGMKVAASSDGAAIIELNPEDALELAAQLSDTYGLHKRWLDARERDPDLPLPDVQPVTGLTVENYRLHILLESGYDLESAEQLAKDASVDLHQARRLAEQAGPELAASILA